MPHCAAFHLGRSLFAKVHFEGFLVYKGLNLYCFLLKVLKDDVQPSLDLYEPQRSDPAEEAKDLGKVKTKGKVTFALQKNTVRSQSVDEGM